MFNYSRFTKNEINKQGYKIGYLDTDVLSELQKYPESSIINTFTQYKIRPAIDKYIAEWLQGLENPRLVKSKIDENANNKIAVIAILEKLGLLWFIERHIVLAIEYIQINNGSTVAHNYYKVFADRPIDCPENIILAKKLRNDRLRAEDTYRCDKGLKYGLQPYRSTSTKIDWKSYIPEMRDAKLANILKQGIINMMQDYNKCSTNIAKSKDIDISECFKKAHIERIEKTLHIHSILSQSEINKIVNYIYNKLNRNSYTQFLEQAPLDVLWRYFDEKYCLEGVSEPNDLLDTMHAMIALSYCDYFITNDGKLQSKCLEAIKKLNLNTKILRLD